MTDEKAGGADEGGAGREVNDGLAAKGNRDARDRADHDPDSDFPSIGESELGANRVTRAAYEGGRGLLSPITIEASRDANFYIDKRIVTGFQETSAAPGPVPDDQIDQLRAYHVPVPGHKALLRALRDRRLLVLLGTRGSGRSTTGLSLLDELTDGKVARLDPAARPLLPGVGQITAGHGYLGSVDDEPVPSRVAADRLAADLAGQGAYCVLTAHPSAALRRELGFYCADHTQASPVEVLGQHVQAGVMAEDEDGLAARMAELATTTEITRLLGAAARPSEAAQAAGLLLDYGRGERSREEIETLISRLVLDDRIEEWFSVLVGVTHGQRADRARRLTAMRIAVAVFDGLPRHIAEGAAEPLAARIAMPSAPPGDAVGEGQIVLPRTGPRGVDPEETATLLATTPIEVTRGEVPFFSRTVPGETIAYLDDRLPSAVLRCVWHNHYPLREPVIAWLADLSRDDRQDVRFRAAQAAGLLCALDYTHTLDALVMPAAKANPKPDPAAAAGASEDEEEPTEEQDPELGRICRQRRQFAAIAMDHVARDERLSRFIRVTLRRWRRDKDPALRWTAARAYGYDIGVRNPAAAFEELKVLGTPWEMRPFASLKPKERRLEVSVFHAAGQAVADLFGSGGHHEVLAVLHEWSVDPRWSVRLLALQAIVNLIPMMASTIGTPEPGGARVDPDKGIEPLQPLLDPADRDERGRWPILVALHARQPELQRQGAELVRFALRSRAQKVALKAFEEIFFIADDYPDTALPAVEAFLPLVIKDEPDRGRLLGCLHRMRDAWADPLAVDVAARLEEVILGVPVMTGRKVLL